MWYNEKSALDSGVKRSELCIESGATSLLLLQRYCRTLTALEVEANENNRATPFISFEKASEKDVTGVYEQVVQRGN